MHRGGRVTEDRFAHQHLLDEWAGLGTPDLRAEREHIPAIAEDDGAVHGRQPADRVGCLLEGDVARALADQVSKVDCRGFEKGGATV